MPIGPEKKLTVTLRFLATGESYDSSMYQFRIHKSTITQYISKICGETHNSLKKVNLRLTNTKEEWMIYVQEQLEDGNFQIVSEQWMEYAEFYNYKGFFSILLLALVDYDYKFLFADVGTKGINSFKEIV